MARAYKLVNDVLKADLISLAKDLYVGIWRMYELRRKWQDHLFRVAASIAAFISRSRFVNLMPYKKPALNLSTRTISPYPLI